MRREGDRDLTYDVQEAARHIAKLEVLDAFLDEEEAGILVSEPRDDERDARHLALTALRQAAKQLEREGIVIPKHLDEASLQEAAREFLEGGDPGIDPTTAVALVDERGPYPWSGGAASIPLVQLMAEFATLLLQGQLTGGE